MEYDEFQNKLDDECLSNLNYVISAKYNVKIEGGIVYTEHEQEESMRQVE